MGRQLAAGPWSHRKVQVSATIRLRPPVAADGPTLIALRQASRAHLEPWEPLPPPGGSAYDEGWFERFLANAFTERCRRFLIVRASDDVVVGQVALSEIIRGPLQQAFVGYWIGSEFAGRGYMTDGVRSVVEIAFSAVGLSRLEANVQPHNASSIAVLRKVGFRREGFSPRYLEIAGSRVDHERWALTREEWEPR